MSGGAPPYDVAGYLARHVPLTRAMGLRLAAYGPEGITLAAPLAPNINDKGIAFGGSIASLLALAGWALTDCVLREAGVEADVIVASIRIDYLRPVRGEIAAFCARPPEEEVRRLLADWRRRSRARWTLAGAVEGEGARRGGARGLRRPPAPGGRALTGPAGDGPGPPPTRAPRGGPRRRPRAASA